jgi:putative addiction module component (TIGR02574 family)
MNSTYETVEAAAKQLTLKERSALVHSLLEDIDNNDAGDKETEIETVWLDEVERRIEAYKQGLIGSSSFEEAVENVRTRIAK